VKPTQEQTERLKAWLDICLSALFAGDPSPCLPLSIETDMQSSADFSDTFAEYGFAADGLRLLPNFYEIQCKAGRIFKA
jgi:hypothetical protein